MLAVSQDFLNAQAADANLPVSKAVLILGNYASSVAYGSVATASSSDGSGNFPASGANDGDRTELNVGAPSAADNDVGKSSWRSGTAPSTTTQTLDIAMTQSRTINRIRLFHLTGNGLKSFKFSYLAADNVHYVDFASTTNLGIGTTFATNFLFDVIDFPAVTTTKIRLTIFDTQVAGSLANVIELEFYRIVDITSKVKGITIGRSRDYKLNNPLASTFQLTCNNDDRYFSISHVPTDVEQQDLGFVNTDLKPGVGVQVWMGFNYYKNAPEVTSLFLGEIDRINIRPGSRDAVLEGRDEMKRLINRVDSTKLKTSQDIGANIKYVLNRANFSSYEVKVDTTPLIIDYFFTDAQNALTTIQDLVQAAGDATFFFDEFGVATFRYFGTAITVSHTFTSQADFEAGVLQNISTRDGNNDIFVPIEFLPTLGSGTLGGAMQISGANLTLPQYGGGNNTGASFGQDGAALQTLGNQPNVGVIAQPFTVPRAGVINSFTIGPVTINSWNNSLIFEIWDDNGGTPNNVLYSQTVSSPDITNPMTVHPNLSVAAGTYYFGIARNGGAGAGNFASIKGSLTDSPAAKQSLSGVSWSTLVDTHSAPIQVTGNYTFTQTVVSQSGTWTSPVYDSFSIAVNSTATLSLSGSYPGATSGSFFLDGSPDGVTFNVTYEQDNFNGTTTVSVANRRYWRIRVTLSLPNDLNTPPTASTPLFYFASSGTWTSAAVDTGGTPSALGTLTATYSLNGGSVTFLTATSSDNVTYDAFTAVSPTGQILSSAKEFIKVQVIINLSGDLLQTPTINDITITWLTGTGTPKIPATSSLTFSFNSTLLDIAQELSDNLGGDTAIINDVTVQAQPFLLTGNDSDTAWQGTIGTPPLAVSGSNPVNVTNGQTLTYDIVVSGGMDTTNMSGGNPSAAVVTFGSSAAGTWSFTSINPTRPVLQIVITHTGTITDLRLTGKKFSSSSFLQSQNSTSATSIAAYGRRQLSISNTWIVSTTVAASIASTLITNFSNPVSYIPTCTVRPAFSLQLGDRVTVVDTNLDLSADYVVVGLQHSYSLETGSGDVKTQLTLLKV